MKTVKTKPRFFLPEEGEPFFEASSIRKYNGMYYYVYSGFCTGLYYYYGPYPDREFSYGGRIHSTSDVGINGHTREFPAYDVCNIHGGLACIHGQYYIFDHRMTNHSGFSRQGVAEPVFMDEQGRFAQAEATSCGLNGGPLPAEGEYPSYIACNLFYSAGTPKEQQTACITQDGGDREGGEDQYICGMSNGVTAGFKYFCGNPAGLAIQVRGTAAGRLIIRLEETGEAVAEKELELASESWNWLSMEWTAEWCRTNPEICGKFALFVSFEGDGMFDWKAFSFCEK